MSRISDIEARAAEVWERFKAEEISSPEFVAGIEALNEELPEGMTIRFPMPRAEGGEDL